MLLEADQDASLDVWRLYNENMLLLLLLLLLCVLVAVFPFPVNAG